MAIAVRRARRGWQGSCERFLGSPAVHFGGGRPPRLARSAGKRFAGNVGIIPVDRTVQRGDQRGVTGRRRSPRLTRPGFEEERMAKALSQFENYLVHEFVEDYVDGIMSRRDMVSR